MKNNRPLKEGELEYTFRRVLYNTMVAAQGVSELDDTEDDSSDGFDKPTGTASNVEHFSFPEVNKLAALTMARNLDAFFFPNPESRSYYAHDDDIYYTDFDIVGWSPNSGAKLSQQVRKRLNKIAGHIVTSKPNPFRLSGEVTNAVVPLIQESRDFMVKCIKQNKAKWSAAGVKYLNELNELLPDLEIPVIPAP